tara:strand:+ start:22 stop:414 length:393 start_codon:yes stop_codon:yes gene_type:complete
MKSLSERMMMIKIPKDVHKALAVLFKHKLISEIERQQLMEKSMRRDLSARIVQLPKPREATVALERTLIDISNGMDNHAFDVKEMVQKVEARVGKTTDSAVRYVLGLMVQKGVIEQIHSDGKVLFGKKNR